MQQQATTDSTVAEFNNKDCPVAKGQLEVQLDQWPGQLVAKLGLCLKSFCLTASHWQ